MNRFRKLGFINYDVGDHLRVNSSLLNVVLHDDQGTTPIPEANRANGRRSAEPPARPGEPPDKERAKGPPLPRGE
jgi:hypothetical protein